MPLVLVYVPSKGVPPKTVKLLQTVSFSQVGAEVTGALVGGGVGAWLITTGSDVGWFVTIASVGRCVSTQGVGALDGSG